MAADRSGEDRKRSRKRDGKHAEARASARRASRALLRSESGQSVLEFLLVIPVLVIITMLMVKVNTVINMSIVDQKYAREQIMFVSGNAAEYPARSVFVSVLAKAKRNQLIVGVRQESDGGVEEGLAPNNDATKYYIGRKKGMGSESPGDQTLTERADVRVRNTVTLCLPMIVFGSTPALDFDPKTGITKQYHLQEDPKAWQFCTATPEVQLSS